MKHPPTILAVLAIMLFGAAAAVPAPDTPGRTANSVHAAQDVPLHADPNAAFWKQTIPIYAARDACGKPVPGHRTTVLSRWTNKNLYFLFICPYQKLNLKQDPQTAAETNKLWNWDVAEVFIGSDFENIRRYKEFEMSPQGEWIDLDINLDNPHPEGGWTWNSGFKVMARIDPRRKIWYGAMCIPFASIKTGNVAAGDTLRINFFRSQGPPSERREIAWQPPMSTTFHVPSRFGLLKLVSGN